MAQRTINSCADAFRTRGNLIVDSILVATWNTVRLTFVNKMT